MHRSLLIPRLIINLLVLCTYLNPPEGTVRSTPTTANEGKSWRRRASTRVITVLGYRTRIVSLFSLGANPGAGRRRRGNESRPSLKSLLQYRRLR